jgi:XTP/dITP diphosphohydrolase
MRLIIATRNKGKLREIKDILKELNSEIVSLADLKKKFRIVENGLTFFENASKKALTVSKVYTGDYILGEDSGLEVVYLDGAPGVYSKRYAGKSATDIKNNTKLLRALKGVSGKKRSAQYRCCLVLAKSGKVIEVFQGKLKGLISTNSKGKGGFGYDPVFYLPSHEKTVAQLPFGEKNKISHRAKSFKKLKRFFKSA